MFDSREPGSLLAPGGARRAAREEFRVKTVTGLIVMAVGAAGLAGRQRGYGWLRRQLVMDRGAAGRPAPAAGPEVIPDEEVVEEYLPE